MEKQMMPPTYDETMGDAPKTNETVLPIRNAPVPVATTNINLNVNHVARTCTFCQKPLRAEIKHHTTCSTHCACLCCMLTGICCPFALFVYCTKCCREPRVHCAACGAPC